MFVLLITLPISPGSIEERLVKDRLIFLSLVSVPTFTVCNSCSTSIFCSCISAAVSSYTASSDHSCWPLSPCTRSTGWGAPPSPSTICRPGPPSSGPGESSDGIFSSSSLAPDSVSEFLPF